MKQHISGLGTLRFALPLKIIGLVFNFVPALGQGSALGGSGMLST